MTQQDGSEATRNEPSGLRSEVTKLLRDINSGNEQALDVLMPLVYERLRVLAASSLRAERPDHTLRATALVHEAYLSLVNAEVRWEDRRHFYAVAARMMRRILVDHARAHKRQKRGAGAAHVSLEDAVVVSPEISTDVIQLDESIRRLEELDARKAEIIEMLFFGGLTYEEIGAVLGTSVATVHRELKLAKAWLYRDMSRVPQQA